MKSLFTILIFASTSYLYGQEPTIQITLTDTTDSQNQFATSIELLNPDSTKISATQTFGARNVSLALPHKGTFLLRLDRITIRPEYYQIVASAQENQVSIRFQSPCRFLYTDSIKPVCPIDKKDKLIPIRYGLPYQSTMRKAKRGKVRLGGCIVTGCDPKFFCPKHNIEL